MAINSITVSADNYNLEAGSDTWFDMATDGTLAATASALTGVWNSVSGIGNWIANNPHVNTQTEDVLRNIGMNETADYYLRHKQGADVVGLIGASIIPGTLGIKALNMLGKSERITSTVFGAAAANRLNSLERNRDIAYEAAAQAKGLYSSFNYANLRAVAAGFERNLYESIAFESAALAFTYASPVYEDMDAGDLASTAVTGALFGAGIGGLFSTAKTFYQGRKASVSKLEGTEANAAVKELPAWMNIVRMSATGAHASAISKEIPKLVDNETALVLPMQELLAKKTGKEVAEYLGNVATVQKLGSLEEGAAYTLLTDLRTGAEMAPSPHIVGNIADYLPKGALELIPMPKLNALAVRGEKRRHIDTITVNLNKPIAEMTVTEAQQARFLHSAIPLSGNISSKDIFALEKWVDSSATGVTIDGATYATNTVPLSMLNNAKREALDAMLSSGMTPINAARALNIPESLLKTDSPMALSLAEANREAMRPRYAAITYNVDPFESKQNPLYAAQTWARVTTEAKLNSQNREILADSSADSLGLFDDFKMLLPEQEARRLFSAKAEHHDNPTFIAAANGDYGSRTSWLQSVGKIVNGMKSKLNSRSLQEITSSVVALSKESGLQDELLTVVNKLRLSEGKYVADEAVGDLQLYRMDYIEALNRGEDVSGFTDNLGPLTIKLSDKRIYDHLVQNSKTNLNNYRKPASAIATSHSIYDVKLHERYPDLTPIYVPPVNTTKMPHFVLVREDPKAFGASSHVSVISAVNAADLEERIEIFKKHISTTEGDAAVGRYQFITKGASADYHKALADYQYDRGFNESRVDSMMRRAGVLGEKAPLLSSNTAGKAFDAYVDDLAGWHGRMSARTVRDIVEFKYHEIFQQMRDAGDELLQLERSRFGRKDVETKTSNPYLEGINMALDISNLHSYTHWANAVEIAEQGGSSALHAIKDSWDSVLGRFTEKGRNLAQFDADIAKHNAEMERLGIQPAYQVAASDAFKHLIPKSPILSKFIARVQGILSGFILGIDPIQHMNNVIGLPVMQSLELTGLLKGIAAKNPEAAGRLAYVNVPKFGTPFMTSAKLSTNAINRFFQGGKVWDVETGSWVQRSGKELLQEYEKLGLSVTEMQQMRQVIDNLAITGAEGAAELNSKVLNALEKVTEIGRTATGGNFTERFVRFVSADAIRQITDEGLAQGVLKSQQEAITYWNTAVNRIHGNMMAAQRPVVMQGNIGQAVGMFMTYQMNLLQQLFRNVGAGNFGPVSAMMGLQASLYGMQGLPAFHLINTYLIGNASGNTYHSDIYSTVNETLGKEAAEWILYGAGSNALGVINPDYKFNLYSRGDINPRSLTILPMSVEDTVLYRTTLGFFGNIADFFGNLREGAPLSQAFYQAVQHNSINRPLAGVGAVMAGGQYTKDGKLASTVDESTNILSIGNALRLMGVKPLDDALAADALFRQRAYLAYDRERMKKLAEAVRLTAADTGDIDAEKWDMFAAKYAEIGGNPNQFKSWVLEKLKDAEQTVVERSIDKFSEERVQNYLGIIGANEPEFEPARRTWLEE